MNTRRVKPATRAVARQCRPGLYVLYLAITLAGCAQSPPAAPVARVPVSVNVEDAAALPAPSLRGTLELVSADALSRAVLAALGDKNEEMLQALRVSRETMEQDWLPAYNRDRDRPFAFDLYWETLEIRARSGIQESLGRYGGIVYELLEVVPTEIRDYDTCRIWRKCKLLVRSDRRPEPYLIRPYGSILEWDGKFYIIGYPD